MEEFDNRVFISYRRSVTWALARLLSRYLVDQGFDVFMDVSSLESGEFERIIFSEIAARRHFLPILAPGVVERFIHENDLMRREIEYAMELQRNIVPIIVDEFSFTASAQFLVGKLGSLGNYNGVIVSHEFFDDAMERLRTHFLKRGRHVIHELNSVIRSGLPPEDIKKIINESESTETLTAEAFYNRGYSREKYDRESAIEDYGRAIRLNPDYAMAYSARCRLLWLNEEIDRALKDIQKAIRLNPRDYSYYVRRGLLYHKQGKVNNAISDFNKVIRMDPNSEDAAFAYNNKGNVRYGEEKYQEAINLFTRAIQILPKFALAYRNRGLARYHQKDKDIEGALSDYNEAIRLDPFMAESYYNRGILLYSRGDYKEAIADFSKAISLNPKLASAYSERGRARYYIQGDILGAIRDFDEAIRIDPKFAIAYNNRGWVQLNHGELDKALKDFNMALRLDTKYATAYVNRGIAQRKKGSLASAIRSFTKAIQLDKSQAKPYYYRATIFEKNGDYRRASKDFRKYLELGGGIQQISDVKIMRKITMLNKRLEKAKKKTK
jgi:tetratricopeptide (TPR) repeat protein